MSAATAEAPARPAPATRELVIARCKPIKSGQRRDGKGEWTIYEVEARTPAGQLVTERLRAWELLPLGLPARSYEIQRDVFTRDNGTELVSYFLRLPKPSLTEIRQILDEIFATQARLEHGMQDLDRRLSALEAPEPAASQPTLTDEDIPF